jgi:hypothetical protein
MPLDFLLLMYYQHWILFETMIAANAKSLPIQGKQLAYA